MNGLIVVTFLLGAELILGANGTKSSIEVWEDIIKSNTDSWFVGFEKLANRTTFVDKTLMLKTFLKVSDFPEFALMTCPRKFGKSTILDMMKIFAEAPICENTITGQICKCTDLAHSKILKKCDVSMKITPWLRGDVELYNERCENFATIEVNFKFTDANTMGKILEGFRNSLKSIYDKYGWVLQSVFVKHKNLYGTNELDNPVTANDTESVKRLKRAKILLNGTQYLKEEDLATAFSDLQDILMENYPVANIFWLIDDYDYPILKAIEYDLNVVRVTKQIRRIFKEIFRPSHEKRRVALITGILNVLHESEFSHIKRWNFLDNHHYAQYLGFTEDEVNQLFSKHNIPTGEGNDAKQYYGSYSIVGSSTRIYNPHSMISYASADQDRSDMFENYWTETEDISSIVMCSIKNGQCGKIIKQLLNSKRVKFQLKKYWNVDDLVKLKDIVQEKSGNLTSDGSDLVLSYLFYSGYLSHGDKPGTYSVPGKEMKHFFKLLLKEEQSSDV